MDLYPWALFSKKAQSNALRPFCVGIFTEEIARERCMRLAKGCEGSLEGGNLLHFYWLVDPADGCIVDARFQLFGPAALVAVAEAACTLLIGKHVEQALQMTADELDQSMRDSPDVPALPKESLGVLNLTLAVIEDAYDKCKDLPPPKHRETPIPQQIDGEGILNFTSLPLEDRCSIIEQVLEKEVRPYIEMDAGGISVKELKENNELIVTYEGACTSCYSSIGTTLSTITEILRAKVDPSIVVTPDLEALQL